MGKKQRKHKSALDRFEETLSRHRSLPMLVVALLAAAVRAVHLAGLHGSVFFKEPILDSMLYDTWARRIASGDWLGHDVYFMGPLYPYFLGIVYTVFGRTPLAASAVQLALGLASILLVFAIARRVAGSGVALLSGVLLAFYGPLLFFDGLLLPEFLGILLNLLWIYLLVRTKSNVRPLHLFAVGVLLGLSALARTSALLFLVAIGLWLVLGEKMPLRRVLVSLGVLTLGLLAVLMPVGVRNYVISGDRVLVTSNGGLNFYIGNHAEANGLYTDVKELRMVGGDPESDWTGRFEAEKAAGRSLRPSEVSDFWLGRGLEFVKKSPGSFALLFLRKTFLFWNSFEFPQIEDYRAWKQTSGFPFALISFAFVGPLGILGMLLASHRRSEFFLLRLFVIFYTISICVFFVTARYRVQVVPVLSVFSAYSLWWFAGAVSRGAFSRVLPALLVLAALVPATGRPVLSALGIHPSQGSWYSHFYMGTKLLTDPGSLDRAIEELKLATQLNPANPEAFNNLGLAYERKGMVDDAAGAFRAAIGADSTYVESWYNLAFTAQKQGDYAGAAALYGRVLALQPYLPRAHFNVAICFMQSGNLPQAAAHLRTVISMQPENVEAHNQLGIVLGEQGDLAGAISEFEAALRIDPGYSAARENLTTAVQARGGR
ncbi:MAG: tetratricopeptide repeat protein [Candidatus Eisenbacteria bacterium]